MHFYTNLPPHLHLNNVILLSHFNNLILLYIVSANHPPPLEPIFTNPLPSNFWPRYCYKQVKNSAVLTVK